MSTADAPVPVALTLAGPPARVLIVTAPYYRDVVAALEAGARGVLKDVAEVETVEVAGAFELAQAIRLAEAAEAGRFDGYVALGCVVRGETDHYDFICTASMQGLMQVALEHGLALGTGLLTVATLEQARARATPEVNKGAEAAAACVRQIALARRLGVRR